MIRRPACWPRLKERTIYRGHRMWSGRCISRTFPWLDKNHDLFAAGAYDRMTSGGVQFVVDPPGPGEWSVRVDPTTQSGIGYWTYQHQHPVAHTVHPVVVQGRRIA